jgi:predicted membrane channel-forming protein YqfA (hemolysin III family)
MGIWIVLYSLTLLGMISMGYHAGIVESKRTNATWILSLSFAMVITLIAALDRPWGAAAVTQQPLVDLEQFISAER